MYYFNFLKGSVDTRQSATPLRLPGEHAEDVALTFIFRCVASLTERIFVH